MKSLFLTLLAPFVDAVSAYLSGGLAGNLKQPKTAKTGFERTARTVLRVLWFGRRFSSQIVIPSERDFAFC